MQAKDKQKTNEGQDHRDMSQLFGGAEKLSHVTVVLLALEACKTLEAYKSFQAHKALQAKDKRNTSEGQDYRNM